MNQQPELGRRLTLLRKEKNLTQEELAGKSHVSTRTIQRIEAGEVLPRNSTVRILLEALGESMESFSTNTSNEMNTTTQPSGNNRITLLIAVFAGAVYLALEIMLSVMDIAWLMNEGNWEHWIDLMYISLTVTMMIAYVLFARGFIVLAGIFDNPLLRVATYFMIAAVIGVGILDIVTLPAEDIEFLWIPYAAAAVAVGAVGIVFGVGLIRLQDGMGELSRAAGILEIIAGCTFVTVILFFIGYVIMVPTVVVEILVLYRGYEYLSRSESANMSFTG